MLAGPLIFAVVYEVVRVGTDGPTVDGVHLSIAGRRAGGRPRTSRPFGPPADGARRGGRCRFGPNPGVPGEPHRVPDPRDRPPLRRDRHRSRADCGRRGRGRPATTDPIRDSTGSPASSAVAELVAIDVNRHGLAMMIRGQDRQTGPALPGRRTGRFRTRCDAQSPRGARAVLHHHHLGPTGRRKGVSGT